MDSKTCKNCKYYTQDTFKKYCSKKIFVVLEGSNESIEAHIHASEDFGCNKWEEKDEQRNR